MQPLLAIFGTIGTQELLIIGGIVFLLFGNRLPSVMRSLGRGIVEFKNGMSGKEDDHDDDRDRPAKAEKPRIDTSRSESPDEEPVLQGSKRE